MALKIVENLDDYPDFAKDVMVVTNFCQWALANERRNSANSEWNNILSGIDALRTICHIDISSAVEKAFRAAWLEYQGEAEWTEELKRKFRNECSNAYLEIYDRNLHYRRYITIE